MGVGLGGAPGLGVGQGGAAGHMLLTWPIGAVQLLRGPQCIWWGGVGLHQLGGAGCRPLRLSSLPLPPRNGPCGGAAAAGPAAAGHLLAVPGFPSAFHHLSVTKSVVSAAKEPALSSARLVRRGFEPPGGGGQMVVGGPLLPPPQN